MIVEELTRAPAAQVGASVAAPAAGAVIADSGQLPAGDYLVEICISGMDTVAVGKGVLVEHRNAANGATTRILASCSAGESRTMIVRRITIAANERIRAIAGPAAGAASSLYVATISVYALTPNA